MATVSVVIVNWNGLPHLPRCLNALAAQTRAPDEIVVVDNASTDGSAELIKAKLPGVRVIVSANNLGFAGGANLGVRESTGDYVATLNPDTAPEPGWLEALVQQMDSGADVGMCASLMLFMDRPEMVNSAGIALDVLGIAWDRLGGRPVAEALEPCEVFGPCGGAALYRRTLFDDLGGFDEDFFMYLEDVDLAWRAQASGWRCLYVPGARVLHVHSASAVEGSAFKNYLKARNKVWLIAKNYPWPSVVLWAPPILLYDLMAVALASIRGDWSTLRGRIAGLRGWRRALQKRQAPIGTQLSWEQTRRLMTGVQHPLAVTRRFTHLRVRAGK